MGNQFWGWSISFGLFWFNLSSGRLNSTYNSILSSHIGEKLSRTHLQQLQDSAVLPKDKFIKKSGFQVPNVSKERENQGLHGALLGQEQLKLQQTELFWRKFCQPLHSPWTSLVIPCSQKVCLQLGKIICFRPFSVILYLNSYNYNSIIIRSNYIYYYIIHYGDYFIILYIIVCI